MERIVQVVTYQQESTGDMKEGDPLYYFFECALCESSSCGHHILLKSFVFAKEGDDDYYRDADGWHWRSRQVLRNVKGLPFAWSCLMHYNRSS